MQCTALVIMTADGSRLFLFVFHNSYFAVASGSKKNCMRKQIEMEVICHNYCLRHTVILFLPFHHAEYSDCGGT